jgi:crotonobetainyl-CoA:carnitine CoA-transferase CaiB-like acyl-CoA transferase
VVAQAATSAHSPARVTRPAPVFGQHTREVLREAGYDDAQIDALAAEGVVRLG